MFDEFSFKRDEQAFDNKEDALRIKPLILDYIRKNPNCSMQDIYSDLEVGDLSMYIAIHYLLEEGVIKGEDIYANDEFLYHTDFHYKAVG